MQIIANARQSRKDISKTEKHNKQKLDQERSDIIEERIKNKTESDERKHGKKIEVLKNITEFYWNLAKQ